MIVANGRLYAAWSRNQQEYPSLSRLIPTPTPTNTPTDTPTSTHTPTPTGTAIPTNTPTATATNTATATFTPLPTTTPTTVPTATPTPTSTYTPSPTPTPALLPAPTLLAPPNGASFTGWNAQVVLTWLSVGSLAEDEYYVVRIPYNEAGDTAEFWRKGTSLQVPPNYSLATVGFPDRHYDWSVQVMRCIGNCDKTLDDNTKKQGVTAGIESPTWTFYWHPDISGRPTVPPTPTHW